MGGGEIVGILAICLLGAIEHMEATECLTEPVSNSTNCYMKGSLYSPRDDISGQGRTEEASAEACQIRCLYVSGCSYFSFWKDGGCHLSSSAGKLQSADQGITAGLKSCTDLDLESFSASLSSEYSSSYPSENCLDGNEGSFCHTGDEENPYFVIEYNEPIRIFDVKVIVRKDDCCYGRAKEMVTIVTNTKPTKGKLALDSGSQLGTTFKGPATKAGQVITFSGGKGIIGKYVIVQQQYKGVMNLAEVQVNREHNYIQKMNKRKNTYTNCIQNPECEGCSNIIKESLPLLLQANIIKEGEIGVNNGSLVNQQKIRGQTLTLRTVGDIKTIRTDNEMVTINGTVNRMVGKRGYEARIERPTGLYAAPGDLVTITFPEELVGRVESIDIGNFFAWDFPKPSFPVKTTVCKIGSPYGGLINLNMKRGDSYKGVFTVNITNAIKAPTFIYNVTTNEEWKEIRKYSPKMSVLRVPGQVQIFVQTLKIKDITDMEATMSRIKLTMDALEDMLGLPKGCRPGEEVLYIDPGKAGGGHGGWCTSGFNVVGDALYFEDKVTDHPDTIYYDDFFKEFGTNGLILHEFGHGYCSKDLPNEGAHWFVETVSSYIRHIRGGKEREEEVRDMTNKDMDFPLLFRMVGFSRYSRGKPCGEGTGEFLYKYKHWSWYAICWKWMHVIPSRIHGWNVFKDVHQLDQKITKNYNSQSDRLVDLSCKATKHNMIPLFKVWNIKPSEQAITDNCQNLPESEILSQWLNIVKCVNQSMDHVDTDIRDCAKMPKFPQHKGLCVITGVCHNDETNRTMNNGDQTMMNEKFDLYGSTGKWMSEKYPTENEENCFDRAKDIMLDCKNNISQPITATYYRKKQGNEFNYDKVNYTFPPPEGSKLGCYMEGSKYSPRDDISGQGRTSEESAEACQIRCLTVPGCAYFSFWNDGGCHLSSSAATPQSAQGVTAGLTSCPECENMCSSTEGCPLAKNRLLTILPELKMEFNVSFEFRATAWQSSWQNVIHFTEGGNWGYVGARVPAFWVYNSGRLHPCFAVGDNGNYCTLTTKEYSLNTWHKVEISQTLKNDKYMYRVVVDGEDIFAPVENTKPRTFSNVKVFAADDWHNPLKGSFRNLLLNPRCGDEDN